VLCADNYDEHQKIENIGKKARYVFFAALVGAASFFISSSIFKIHGNNSAQASGCVASSGD
jgi:hypothetical protein